MVPVMDQGQHQHCLSPGVIDEWSWNIVINIKYLHAASNIINKDSLFFSLFSLLLIMITRALPEYKTGFYITNNITEMSMTKV